MRIEEICKIFVQNSEGKEVCDYELDKDGNRHIHEYEEMLFTHFIKVEDL